MTQTAQREKTEKQQDLGLIGSRPGGGREGFPEEGALSGLLRHKQDPAQERKLGSRMPEQGPPPVGRTHRASHLTGSKGPGPCNSILFGLTVTQFPLPAKLLSLNYMINSPAHSEVRRHPFHKCVPRSFLGRLSGLGLGLLWGQAGSHAQGSQPAEGEESGCWM